MKVIRKHTCLKKITKHDDCYVNASLSEIVGFIWELTAEIWSLRDKDYVERRLQRNVTNLIKR